MLKVTKEREEPIKGFEGMSVNDGEGDKEFWDFRALQAWTSLEKKKTKNVDYYTEQEKTKIKIIILLMELKNLLTQKERKYVVDFIVPGMEILQIM